MFSQRVSKTGYGRTGYANLPFVQAYAEQWHRTLQDSMRSTEYDTVSDRYDGGI